MTQVCLDLFSGLGGFSAAFEVADDWEVSTVDLDSDNRFDPDLRADIMDLRPADVFDLLGYDRDQIDVLVVLASPPCTDFSMAASRYEKVVDGEPNTPSARESVALVYHTIGLIRSLSPDYWFMENPTGYLRQIIGRPEGRVTYCQYGTEYMKPTDLWGEHPRGFEYRSCKFGDDCHLTNRDGAHGGEGNPEWANSTQGRIRDPAKCALVPYELSEAILEAVEGRSEQSVLPLATAEGGHPDGGER